MKTHQRLGLLGLLSLQLLLQLAYLDVLRYFTPVHLPLASCLLLPIAALASAALLLLEDRP